MSAIRPLAALHRIVLAAALATAPSWATNKGPDAAQYTGTDATAYSFIDIAGAGGSASVLSNTDDGAVPLTIPFPFQFYGHVYTTVCVSSNGIMTFVSATSCGTGTVSDFANADLTVSGTPGDPPAILPFWTDLTFQVAGGGAVYYQTIGSAGSRKFVVQWNNAYPRGSTNSVTFQAILGEGNNQVLFQYKTVNLGQGNPASNGALATVGIRDSGGNTTNRQIAWSYNAPVLGNGVAVLFAPPASDTSSVNTIATSPSGLSVTIDGVAYPTPKVVSWTPGSSHTLSLTAQQTNGGVRNTFTSWSTGATTPQISITAQNVGTTLTANFSTQYQLAAATNPANAGTVAGGGWYAPNTKVPVQANAAAGYTFVNFSGDLTGSANPQSLGMNWSKNVVANFSSSSTVKLSAAVVGKADGPNSTRVWTIRLSNTGTATASAAQITGATVSQVLGTPCAPPAAVASTFPVAVGDIAPGSSANGQVSFNLSGCDSTARFAVVVRFAANGGAYTGSTTINNQTK